MERLTFLWQIKRRSKPKPSSVWFSQNQFKFAAKIFFYFFSVFTDFFLGQIPTKLAEISNDLRLRPFFWSSPTLENRFPENQHRFAVQTFFLVFTYFWEKISEMLAKVNINFVQQTSNYLEFNLNKNACGPQ